MAPLNFGTVSLFVTTALAASGYAPVHSSCPSTSLVRSAEGLSSDETTYINARKTVAAEALKTWLTKTNSAYASVSNFPVLGLTTSGGGYRSMLAGGGVVQGLDKRDSNVSTSGLYQALTYQAGLSGGSWLVSSLAGNDWPTISSVRDALWVPGLEKTLFLSDTSTGGIDVTADLAAKDVAGFDTTLTDPWGRLLSYQFLYGIDGGVSKTLSGIATNSQFAAHEVPLPILTALGVKTWEGACDPEASATQYEFTPFEFGSWDSGVAAFTPTKYLGSELTNGKPSGTNSCVTNFDNLGFVFGTSSSLFNAVCVPVNINQTELGQELSSFILEIHELASQDLFARYPNPFHNYSSSTAVSAQKVLDLVDGGLSNQNNPIWPMLHRDIDVLLVNDNSADTDENWPNGTEIYNTYLQAQAQGLDRMPTIPTVETFVSEGLNQRPTFFGCNETEKMTIVFIPNYNYTYASNTATLKLQYSEEETDGIIANGVQVASEGGDAQWGNCLACGIMAKTGEALPDACTACLAKYCYN